jgi:hypothetical protein
MDCKSCPPLSIRLWHKGKGLSIRAACNREVYLTVTWLDDGWQHHEVRLAELEGLDQNGPGSLLGSRYNVAIL